MEITLTDIALNALYNLIKKIVKPAWKDIEDTFKDKNINLKDCGLSLQNSQKFVKKLHSITRKDLISQEYFNKFIINNAHNGIGDIITIKIVNISKILTHLPTNDFCLGREKELEDIKKELEQNNSLLLNGVGGIGKSTLAMEYAQINRSKYKHIAFVEQKGDIKSSFVNAFSKYFTLDDNAPFDDLSFKLQNLDGENLLIIDNLSDGFEHIKDLAVSFKILITSRVVLNNITSYEVKRLTKENAILLFKEFNKNENDNEKIEKILEYIDYHTLFIEIIAKTLNSSAFITMENILNKFHNRELPAIKTNLEQDNFNGFLNELFKINNLKAEELLLLQRLSLFPSMDLTFNDLVDFLSIKDKENFDSNLNKIHNQGWITKNKDSFKLHQIIKEFFLKNHKLEYSQYEDIIINFRTKLHLKPEDNPIDKFKYMPIVSSILNETNHKEQNIASLLNNISMIYQDMGDLEKALKYQEKALKLTKEILGEKHPDLASSYNNISLIYQDMGDLEKALKYQKKFLKLTKEILEEKHPDLATSYNNISLIYQDMGDLEKALKYQEKALKLRKEILGEKHPDLAINYNNISTIYKDMGELEKALKYQEKFLKLTKEILGEKHPSLAISYNNISVIYQDVGDLEKALEYQEKALKLKKEILGEKHPDLAISYNNISLIYRDIGELEKAKESINKAEKIFRDLFPDGHPNLDIILEVKKSIYQ